MTESTSPMGCGAPDAGPEASGPPQSSGSPRSSGSPQSSVPPQASISPRPGRCGRPIEEAAGVGLCREHLVAAYEWMVGEVGVTDLLPSPCLACGSRLGVRYPSGWLCAVCEWRYGEHPEPGDGAGIDGGDQGAEVSRASGDPDGRGSARTGRQSTGIASGYGRVDVVYYLRWRDRIKIGTSSNPRSRLAQLRHEELLAFERGGRALEQARHAEFAALRLGGEWFSAEGGLLEHVARLQASGDDPWLLHARWRSAALALSRTPTAEW